MKGESGACLHGGGLKLVTDDVVSEGPPLTPVSATLFGPNMEPLDEVFVSVDDDHTLRVTPKSDPLLIAGPAPALMFSGYYRVASAETDTRVAEVAALGAAFHRGPTPLPRPLGEMPSAFVYFAQFIAHEVSRLHIVSNGKYENLNSSRLDLDTILWPTQNGPAAIQPDLAQVGALAADGVALGRTSEPTEDRYADIPRSFAGMPRVPDPRCDANLAVSQMHVAIVRHYLNLVAQHGADARRRLLAEIHQITLYDFLPRVIRRDIYDDVLAHGRQVVMPGSGNPGDFLVPIEFAAAAFRFGHTLVRQTYAWSRFDPQRESLQSTLQQATYTGGGLDTHLFDRHRCLDTVWEIDWTDMIGPNARNLAPLISTAIAPQLTELPAIHVQDATGPVNLAQLSLERGRQLRLPSAQALRDKFGAALVPDFLTESQLLASLPGPMAAALLAGPAGDRLADRTPLWFYVIREAEVLGGGTHLGPIGGRLVMETLHAAICAAIAGPAPGRWDAPITLHDLLTDLYPATSARTEDIA
jgi:hypothetical protein